MNSERFLKILFIIELDSVYFYFLRYSKLFNLYASKNKHTRKNLTLNLYVGFFCKCTLTCKNVN